MNDFLLVGIIQRISNLFDNRQDIIDGKTSLFAFPAYPAAQVFALHALHNKIIVAVGIVPFQIFRNSNILMNQFGNQLEVIFDILHFNSTVAQFRRQCFESNFDTGSFIETAVNHAHSALTEFCKDFITAHNQIADIKSAVRFSVSLPGERCIVTNVELFTCSAIPHSRHCRITVHDVLRHSPGSYRSIHICHFCLSRTRLGSNIKHRFTIFATNLFPRQTVIDFVIFVAVRTIKTKHDYSYPFYPNKINISLI